MKGTGRLGSAYGEEPFDPGLHIGFSLRESRVICRHFASRGNALLAQIITDGVGQHKVSIGKTLHKSRCTQAIGPVIRKIGLAADKHSGDGRLQVIIHPESAHGVVHGGKDHHRCLVGIVSSDALIHVKKVSVALLDGFLAVALDRIAEVQENAQTSGRNTTSLIADFLCSPRRNITRCQIAKTRILAFEKVITILFYDGVRIERTLADSLRDCGVHRGPDPTVIA